MTDEFILNIYHGIKKMEWDTLYPIDPNKENHTERIQVIRELIFSGEPLILTNDQKWLIRLKTDKCKHPIAYQSVTECGLMPETWKTTLKGKEWSEIETKQGKKKVYCDSQYYEITNEHGQIVAIESKR